MSGTQKIMTPSQPKAERKKYRDPAPEPPKLPANIMFDPRVCRGTTSLTAINAATISVAKDRTVDLGSSLGKTAKQGTPQQPKKSTKKKTGPAWADKKEPKQAFADLVANTHVVKERVEVPIHLYLEEQTPPPSKIDMDTQTDAFKERPPTPPYLPPKTGLDVSTQVENKEVFDFNRDVESLVVNMVSKTIDQAAMEVKEEEELKKIRRFKDDIRSREQKDAADVRAIEEAEVKRLQEKNLLLKEAQARAAREQAVRKKCMAMIMGRRYLTGALDDCINRLDRAKFFSEDKRGEADTFLPWLYDRVTEKVQATRNARQAVDDLLSSGVFGVVQQQLVKEAKEEEERQRQLQLRLKREQEEAEKRERERVIRIFVRGPGINNGTKPVGPVTVHPSLTIEQVEQAVADWLVKNLPNPPHKASERLKFFRGADVLDKTQRLSDMKIEDLGKLELRVEVEAEKQEKKEDEEEKEDDQESGDESKKNKEDGAAEGGG